jgi:hypothetical protein
VNTVSRLLMQESKLLLVELVHNENTIKTWFEHYIRLSINEHFEHSSFIVNISSVVTTQISHHIRRINQHFEHASFIVNIPSVVTTQNSGYKNIRETKFLT